MNQNQKESINKLIDIYGDLFSQEILTDENKDYKRGFLAGRLFSAIIIQNLLLDKEQNNDND